MLRTDIDSQERPATGRTVIAIMMLAVTVTSGIASASEDVAGRVAAARRIILRDDDLITPSALTMSRGDVLEFENDSGQFMRLVFVEPQDQTDKIRCYPIDHTIARRDQTPWMLFDWGLGQRLAATIPPGKFASECSRSRGICVRRDSSKPRPPRCRGFARDEGHDHGSSVEQARVYLQLPPALRLSGDHVRGDGAGGDSPRASAPSRTAGSARGRPAG